MWRCGQGFEDSTRILLKVDLHTGEILVNNLDEFWAAQVPGALGKVEDKVG